MSHAEMFHTFPMPIQTVMAAYANQASLSLQGVIEFAAAQFLELDAATQTEASLQTAIERYASETEMPPEVVVELAVTHFLDPESATFEDCSVGVQREPLERLQRYVETRQISAA